MNLGYDAPDGVESAVVQAEKAIFDITQNNDSNGVVHIREVLGDSFRMMQDM